MLLNFKITKTDNEFTYLENEEGEEIKIKNQNLLPDIKDEKEIMVYLFEKNGEKHKELAKNILNEILNKEDSN